MSDNIQVIVRCRGRNGREVASKSPTIVELPNDVFSLDNPFVSVCNDSPSLISSAAYGKVFKVDQVYGPNAEQALIFENVVTPLFQEFINGINVTILAYGQTGSGKTYSMCGDIQGEHAGIIPRVLTKLFTALNGDYFVKLSCIELYKEELRDLLIDDNGKTKLRLVSDNKRSATVQNLTEIHIDSCEMGFKILQMCLNKRRTSATKLNDLSSRSHTIFTIYLYRQTKSSDSMSDYCVSRMNLVDLAGSEDINKSGAVNERAREAGSINQSLLALGKVINSLSEGKEPKHIPYRESKLTRLLQGSIGGRTKTALIATISPAKINAHETLSTLNYASRAKNIKNLPQSTLDSEMVLKKVLVGELSAQISRITRDLMATKDKEGGIKMSTQNYDEYKLNMVSMESDLKERNAEVKNLNSRIEKKNKELEELREQLKSKEAREEEMKLQLATERENVGSLNLQMSELRDKYTCQKEQLVQVVQSNIGQVSDVIAEISQLIRNDETIIGGDLDTLKNNILAQINKIKEKVQLNTEGLKLIMDSEISKLQSLLIQQLDGTSFDIPHDLDHEIGLLKANHDRFAQQLQANFNPESGTFRAIVDNADSQFVSQTTMMKERLLEGINKTVEEMFKANHNLFGSTITLSTSQILTSGSREVAQLSSRNEEAVNSVCNEITRKNKEVGHQLSALESHIKQEIQATTKNIGYLLKATLDSALGEVNNSVGAVSMEQIDNTISSTKQSLQKIGTVTAKNLQSATDDLTKFQTLLTNIEVTSTHKRSPLRSNESTKRRKPMAPLKIENGTFQSHIPQLSHSK